MRISHANQTYLWLLIILEAEKVHVPMFIGFILWPYGKSKHFVGNVANSKLKLKMYLDESV